MPTLRMLKTFRAVARTGSFTEAAERVALTQAAVSLQMRGLEEALGRCLFDRGGRRIALTRDGLEIRAQVDQILDLLDALKATPANAMDGPVTIGAVVSVIGALSLAVASLKTIHPRLDARLLSARSDELAHMVEQGAVDMAAIVGHPNETLPPGLKWTPLYTEPLVLIVNHAVTGSDPRRILRDHEFLRFDRSVRTGRVVEHALGVLGLQVNEFLELNSIETIMTLVRKNAGVTVLPQLHRADWQSDPALRLISIGRPSIVRPVGLIERAGSGRPGIATAIVASLAAAERPDPALAGVMAVAAEAEGAA